MEYLKEQHERSAGDAFFEWFNAKIGTNFCFSRRAGEAPDLVYSNDDTELFVEVTSPYYDDAHGEFLWEGARNSNDTLLCWTGMNPDKSLANAVAERISQKSKKRYGSRCLLLIAVPPGVTSYEKLAELLVQQSLPKEIPFAGVYVAGRFPITSSSAGGYRVIPIRGYPPA